MALPAEELLKQAPWLQYVYVRRASLFSRTDEGGIRFLPQGDPESPEPRLVEQLLTVSPDAFPPGFRLVKELAFEQPTHAPYARLFAIERTRRETP
jgi:hypothetical protein